MNQKTKRKELEARLEQKSNEIQARIDALQHEVTSTGTTVKDFVAKRPFLAVGGTLLTGVIVGLLLSGRREKHEYSLDEYVNSVSDDIRKAVKKGRGLNEVLEETLRRQPPIILNTSPGKRGKRGIFRTILNMSMNMALRRAEKMATEYLVAALNKGQKEGAESQPE